MLKEQPLSFLPLLLKVISGRITFPRRSRGAGGRRSRRSPNRINSGATAAAEDRRASVDACGNLPHGRRAAPNNRAGRRRRRGRARRTDGCELSERYV
ncbi:hypothetical protein EVAR_50585_1 [Eumeta japonica]|uniref:Uncharacterized protein n=1 Tax=Eumeta variegata TaxID=151549 RepID=A0A4C1YAN4_EUMVA|nr:hypothetical protein EVAR_50585_1 [Eumeta japonica]